MNLSADEIDCALDALRAGATITIGGSRAHSTYGFENGNWYGEDFDEGAIGYRTISEADIRQLAIERPQAVQPLLRGLVWREFQIAFADGNAAAAARTLLARWRDYGGDDGQADILAAVLDGPAATPSPQVCALIRARVRDRVAFHLVMDTLGWDMSPASARRGLALVERLLAMSGDDSAEAHELRERLRALADAPVAAPDISSPSTATPSAETPRLASALSAKP